MCLKEKPIAIRPLIPCVHAAFGYVARPVLFVYLRQVGGLLFLLRQGANLPRQNIRTLGRVDMPGRCTLVLGRKHRPMHTERFIVREERTWLEDISATRDLARQVAP